MNYVGRLLSNFKGFYNDINSATLTGAIDIVIVQQQDGTYITSPWHVRFGKIGILRSREKVVDIEINGVPVDIQMKLGEAGEAFFVHESNNAIHIPDHLATSPLPNALELMEEGLSHLHKQAAEDGPVQLQDTVTQTEVGDELLAENTQSQASQTVIVEHETKIFVETDSSKEQDLESHFCPVSSAENPTNEVSIQTDMSGIEVETKTSRTRLSSGDSCLTTTTSTTSCSEPATQQPATSCNSESTITISPSAKMPSFIRLDSDVELTKKAVKEKRRRKRKKSPAAPRVYKDTIPGFVARSAQLEVGSTGSCSSVEFAEEGLFELELSGDDLDHLDNAGIHMTTMGRTVSMPLIEDRQAWTDEWASSQYAAAFHPFSDGDLTPVVSPVGSRPPSPKSDSELETANKYDAIVQTHITGDDLQTQDSVRWRWGELPENYPTVNLPESQRNQGNRDEEKPSGGLFRFMRSTKKLRHQPEQEGIYLEDLKLSEMDPEVAALYLYQGKSSEALRSIRENEDNESGRGASLPQSPITVDTNPNLNMSSFNNTTDLSLSLCGGLKESDGMIPHEKFLQSLVTFDEFCENPNILSNPNLVIKMDEKYYNWPVAGPMLMAAIAFQRPLPQEAMESLVKQHMPKKEAQRRRGWMWWSRSVASGGELPAKKDQATSPPSSNQSSAPNSPQKAGKSKKQAKDGGSSGDESDTSERTDPKSLDTDRIALNDSLTISTNPQMSITAPKGMKDYCKSLKLSSEEITKLKLQPGTNDVSFSVTSQYQGTSRCTAYIHLWKWDDRIIISDIDGTITKSDVLGQLLPMVGKDWSQVGIAKLYCQIEKNGYRFLYLSARAIGQSKITRDYLKSIRQGELGLPDGPLLLSPSSLISAFHREVIERRPQDFKISCLRDIKALFPSMKNCFYAGFGNKINDVWSYQAVNIPISRIFTVNHKGELRHEMTCTFQSTYTKMSDTVDHLFPPLASDPELGKIHTGNFPAPDRFSNFTYWRSPLPDIEIELESLLGDKKKPKKK